MKYLNLVALSLLVISCAKVRETNNIGKADIERVEKEVLTGLSLEKNQGIKSFQDLERESKESKIWFHKVTVTNVSSYGGPLFIGLQGDLKAGYFKFNEESLEFLSALNPNTVDDGKIDDLIYAWDVDHSEYRYSEINGRPTNTLEENNFIPWYNKSFFEIDWAKGPKLQSGFDDFSQCWKVKDSYLLPESTEYSKDYVTFVKRISYEINGDNSRCYGLYSKRRGNRGHYTFQADLTYSFKLHQPERDPSKKYEPYVYNGEFDPLIQKYGYFKTVFEERGENGRLKVNFLMNRWNPKTKVHKLYFAPKFPSQYKWVFKTDPNKKDPYGKNVIGVIDQTNKVLEDAGVDMRFEISDAPKGVKFGDLRYSFIKFMEEPNDSSPLGYGPSDASPFTGEIISANSMVWTGSLKYYIELIEEWIKRGDFTDGSSKSFYAEMGKILGTGSEDPEAFSKWASTSKDLQHSKKAGYVFKRMLPKMTYGLTQWAPFTTNRSRSSQVGVEPIFKFFETSNIQNQFSRVYSKLPKGLVDEIKTYSQEHINEIDKFKSQNYTTIYKIDSSLQEAVELLLEGKNAQEVIDTILYRVSMHEFGHNLNLRHNFYGSVDKNNFGKGEVFKHPKTGEVKKLEAVSSSVMDYLSLDGQIHASFEWEAYDKAALSFAYSSGKVDHSEEVYPEGHAHAGVKKDFLFCTDEQRFTNALCNTWDLGTTPTEILINQIQTYQKSYFTTNFRFGRAYWDTSNYGSRIFGTMWNIKKFMMLDQAAFTYNNPDLSSIFSDLSISSSEEGSYFEPIKRDIRRAVKISIAFYNSVLQQTSLERQYFSEYDGLTGSLVRQGISSDKFFATYFLLGDDSFYYNPNIPIPYASYLEYEDDSDISGAIKKVSENLLTQRVDSEPGFINFARLLYANNAVNYYNQNNAALANRFKMVCYHKNTFKQKFGIDPLAYKYNGRSDEGVLIADIMNVVTDLPEGADLSSTEFADEFSDIGFAFIENKVYVASQAENEIAFNVIRELRDENLRVESDADASSRLGLRKSDVKDIRYLYKRLSTVEEADCR